MTTRVYKFGLLAPSTHATEVRELLFTAHRYRNQLTEIERERRKLIRDALGPGLHEAEVRAEEVEERCVAVSLEIKAHHAAARTRKTPEALTARQKTLKAERKTALAAFRALKRDLYASPATQDALAGIKEMSSERARKARGESGLAPHAWGTYQRVEAAADASRKMPLYDGIEPNDPRFHRYGGEGSFAIHLQNDNAMAVEKLFKPNNWVRVDALDARVWIPETPRGERRRLSRTILRIRIGVDEQREPVFATFPMIMHREIPPGSVISWVVVQLRRTGPREEWTVSFTVSLPDAKPVPSAARGRGAVAIDIGWRLVPGIVPGTQDLRVCAHYGEDGKTGDLRLRARDLSGLGSFPDSIRANRDDSFNLARRMLSQWIAAETTIPDWLTRATRTLEDWRSPARLAKMVHEWRDARFPADAEIYLALEAWRYRDRHLWQYETGQRTGALRNRREIYRRFGAMLASRYETVVFEDFDLRRLARRPKTFETDKNENETARTNRFLAATSELRGCILNAFASRGGSSAKVNALDSTRICHSCGSVEVFDAAAFVVHACSACGLVWDQDENASRVLFERFRGERDMWGAREAGKGSKVVEERESKWARIKREAEERRGGRRRRSRSGR